MTLDSLTHLGAAIAAIAGGVAGGGYLYRRIRNGMKLADLLADLPKRLNSIDEAVSGMHDRMDKAENAHDETLQAVASLDEKVASHLRWSEGEMRRRTEAEAQLWDALKTRPDEN